MQSFEKSKARAAAAVIAPAVLPVRAVKARRAPIDNFQKTIFYIHLKRNNAPTRVVSF